LNWVPCEQQRSLCNPVLMANNIPAIGEKGNLEIRELRNHLLQRSSSSPNSLIWKYRIAPSIISRSEAGLLGISVPRFAMRVYIEDQAEGLIGFVNARRIGEFCDQARVWGQSRPITSVPAIGIRENLKERRRRPAWVMRKNSCIGDSLLQLPTNGSCWQGYNSVSVNLGVAYGEQEFQGTSYLRQIVISGGGLCSQAACFMTTAMLHDFAKGVWGIADVTAFAAGCDGNTKFELLIKGLDQEGMLRYFCHPKVGLRARWLQAVPTGQANLDYPLLSHFGPLGVGLRGYLRSNMPPIFPLDSGRMAGIQGNRPLTAESIFTSNDLVPRGLLTDDKAAFIRNHAVVVVGWKSKDAFLLHDPGSRPFLKANAMQLSEAGFYTDKSLKEVTPGRYLSVTPFEVRLPLSGWLPDTNLDLKVPLPGLLTIAEVLHYSKAFLSRAKLPIVNPNDYPGEFRLLQRIDNCIEPQNQTDDFCINVPDPQLIVEQSARSGRWCWLQWTGNTLWVWNAEKEPPMERPSPQQSLHFLLAAFQRDGNSGWRRVWVNEDIDAKEEANGPQKEAPATNCAVEIPHSLITSFKSEGFAASLKDWPSGIRNGEFYCMLQCDIDRFGKSLKLRRKLLWQYLSYTLWVQMRNIVRASGKQFYSKRIPNPPRLKWGFRSASKLSVSWPIASAVEQLADIASRKRSLNQIAKELQYAFALKNIKCVGFATFIPELVATESSRKIGVNALRSAIHIAAILNETVGQVKIVEVVGGSLAEGIWPAIDSEQKTLYVANLMSRSEAISRLLTSLREVRTEAQRADITLAIELEPGPLFVMHDWDALKSLCDALDARENMDLSPTVGLNLDIAHWSLAGITPKMIESAPSVLNRIVHCHISDHGRGHFGDVAIARINDNLWFEEWLRLVKRVALNGQKRRQNRLLPYFCGSISIELEACNSSEDVRFSVAKLTEIWKNIAV
jgi:sugar phosphate isomerase/epimerase